ncbi:MAG: dephospho-CoA kinase [Candidatus Competibacteraceae bacterium]|jgi:dephospho-CoA kinase|nr:dephospho-CoA kinase [Candidatus Competibacteraceae bacterium]
MLVVGLTGGIGSGKSAVSAAFEKRGVPVIDTDQLARDLVAPGQPALQEIVAAFGPGCLNQAGVLDRSYLRKTVFADPLARTRLEGILHPRIQQAVQDQLAAISATYCLVVVPLLAETEHLRALMDLILVVDVPEELQVQRVMVRDGVDKEHVQRILDAQIAPAQRLAVADDVIHNDGTLESLDGVVEVLHEKYLSLS